MISVVYAVHNEEKMLPQSLRSVEPWADEIVIVDGESTDKTLAIAKDFGAKIIKTTNKANFHINKQMAIDAAKGDLILQLDADEVVDRDLQDFILDVHEAGQKNIAAWEIARKNLFFNHWLRKGGQYPDKVIRLFWSGQAYLPQKDVHEQMTVKGQLATANGHLLHYGNPDLSSYLQKFNTYTSFKAMQLAEAKLPRNFATTWQYLIHKPLATFCSLYLRHRGYVDGWPGFLFAYFSGCHHAVAYLKYCESSAAEGKKKLNVFYPTSRFAKLQAHRGVGRYTAWLQEYLAAFADLNLQATASDAQIIHYSFFDLFTRSLRPFSRAQSVVITIHDLTPLLFPADFPVGHRGRLNLSWQKFFARRARLILTDSQASKTDIVKLFQIPAEKIKVVYLAANPDLAPATSEQIKNVRAQYHLPANYLLYVGDINFNKNLRQLIKALKFLPSKINLVCVGKNFVAKDIPEWHALEEQIHLSEVESRVIFLTQISSNSELSALYSGALAYIQPSYYEGFGLPILEAMRCKTPVVCQRNSSLPEVAGDFAVYSDSLQAHDFAEAVKVILAWPENKRQQWLRQAYNWQTQFTWERTATQVHDVYLDLASDF